MLAKDDTKNNDFDYRVRGVAGVSPRQLSDFYCPFTAHTRKTAPRDLDPYIQRRFLEAGMIVRGGIPYGEEVCLTHDNISSRSQHRRLPMRNPARASRIQLISVACSS